MFKMWPIIFNQYINICDMTCSYLRFTKYILGKMNLDFPNKINAN